MAEICSEGSKKCLRGRKHLWNWREKVFQQLLPLSSGLSACSPREIKRRSSTSCLRSERLFAVMSPNEHRNTCTAPVVGCKVLSRFYLLQETVLKFRISLVVPPAPSTIRKKAAVSTFLYQSTSKLAVLFIRGCQHIQRFTTRIKGQAPFLLQPKISQPSYSSHT